MLLSESIFSYGTLDLEESVEDDILSYAVFVDDDTGISYRYDPYRKIFTEISDSDSSDGAGSSRASSPADGDSEQEDGEGSDESSDSAGENDESGAEDAAVGKNKSSKKGSQGKTDKNNSAGSRSDSSDDDDNSGGDSSEKDGSAEDDGNSDGADRSKKKETVDHTPSEYEDDDTIDASKYDGMSIDDMLDAIYGVDGEEDDDRKDRIKDALSGKNSDFKKEVQKHLKAVDAEHEEDRKAEERRVAELLKDKYGNELGTVADFEESLKYALLDQIRDSKNNTEYSYRYLHPQFNNTVGDVIMPGEYEVESSVPTIRIYFDQSGSWSKKDIEAGEKVLAWLNDMKDRGEIESEQLYFADKVSYTAPNGGGTDLRAVLDDIEASSPDNVIIMTDSDADYNKLYDVEVPGCVWFLWKNGEVSRNLQNHLSGSSFTGNYRINVEE